MVSNKENTFTEQNRFLVYSDQLDATVQTTLDTVGEMIARSAIQTFEDEGETVTATDASYLAGLTVDGKSVQNGTPTQSVPVPIKVVKSPNPFENVEWQQGTINATGSIPATAAANRIRTVNVKIIPGLVYKIGLSNMVDYQFVCRAYSDESRTVANYVSADSSADWESSEKTWIPTESNYLSIVVRKGDNANLTPADAPNVLADCGILLSIDGVLTPIDLQGGVLASLPDGTKDVLRIDSAGRVMMEKRVSHIASYNGESVGNVYLSTTGDLTTGAEVYYKASSIETIDLGYITMPAIPDGAEISIVAQVTPTIAVKWWTKNQNDVAAAFSAISSDLATLQSAVSALDARVTVLESANAKSLVLEKTEGAKELASEPEETDEQEEIDEQEEMNLDEE